MTRKFQSGDRVKTKPNTSWVGVDCVGTVIGYYEAKHILVKFDDLTYGHSGSFYYREKGIKYDPKNRQHLYVLEEDLCLLEGE